MTLTSRVVITGPGTVNPLGLTVAETWAAMTNGVSGIAPLTLFDTKDFLVKVGGEVKNFDPAKYMEAREARRRDRCQQLASAARIFSPDDPLASSSKPMCSKVEIEMIKS